MHSWSRSALVIGLSLALGCTPSARSVNARPVPAPVPTPPPPAALSNEGGEQAARGRGSLPAEQAEPEIRVTDSGLGIVDLEEGEGPEAVEGAEVVVHYVGRLEDGRVFDASRERGRPFRFELGSEQVIEAWEEGLLGMKVGGRRRLIAPPHLAYGKWGHGVIPGDAILEFEIDLLEVERLQPESPASESPASESPASESPASESPASESPAPESTLPEPLEGSDSVPPPGR